MGLRPAGLMVMINSTTEPFNERFFGLIIKIGTLILNQKEPNWLNNAHYLVMYAIH